MKRITVLSKQIAELIAAGEVVERPASVVKELVENAIDAGAASVIVEIKNGGISFIRVTDDGCGILREDVQNAFVSHATSKIITAEDLDSIGTLGFRGEALASICAVSKISMLTRTADELAGTNITVEGGVITASGDTGCPVGTTIIVRDLFFNTPARMKFLKKDVSEANAIAACIDRIALSHPEVSFKFIREQKTTLHTSGDSNLLSCAYSVFGREFAAGLIETEYQNNGIHVKGLISKPEASRATRSMQYFFVNGRFVRTRTAMAALEEAFKGAIMVGKFPSCILHLTIPFHTVDVNVHPSKIEVRFVNERPIFDAVYFAVKNSLVSLDAPPKLISKAASLGNILMPPQRQDTVVQQRIDEHKSLAPFQSISAAQFRDMQPEFHDDARPLYNAGRQQAANPNFPVKEAINQHNTAFQEVSIPNSAPEFAPPPVIAANACTGDAVGREMGKIIGEAFDTYILLQKGEDILVIDKHAAHERIIYERLKAQDRSLTSQLLLSPVTVTLPKDEYSAVIENRQLLQEMGFPIEDFGSGSVLVREFPLELAKEDISAVICELADNLGRQKRDITPHILDDIYHSIACRAAVKAHDKTGAAELAELVSILSANDEIKHCPHGRPVAIMIEKKELEKRFGRV